MKIIQSHSQTKARKSENKKQKIYKKTKNSKRNKPYQITNISLLQQVVYISPNEHTFENKMPNLGQILDRSE